MGPRICKVILKLGSSQIMENRLPDGRELSYQHLMAGRVKHTFKASRLCSSSAPPPFFRRREYLWKRPDFSNPRSFILNVPGPVKTSLPVKSLNKYFHNKSHVLLLSALKSLSQ